MSVTYCDRCGLVLMERGKRIHEANFDSAIPHQHRNDYAKGIIYALCNKCYDEALTKIENPSSSAGACRQNVLNKETPSEPPQVVEDPPHSPS